MPSPSLLSVGILSIRVGDREPSQVLNTLLSIGSHLPVGIHRPLLPLSASAASGSLRQLQRAAVGSYVKSPSVARAFSEVEEIVANWGFVIAGLVDMQKPPEVISRNMTSAMCFSSISYLVGQRHKGTLRRKSLKVITKLLHEPLQKISLNKVGCF
ncbi:hypothetical protein OPV22_011298 [Ensete ventricosum]|uniref:Mitochondrial pyruvate carrier n=1 Tax=Ensete ventricosum TaxID=4639 RepID=A0AAV8RD56_ENSVE|nr:hypothetical protein OPV22_011298 [Ensete ventricosum]